jgi:hypothetical protein
MSPADRVNQLVEQIARWEERHGVPRSSPDAARRLAMRVGIDESQRRRRGCHSKTCKDCGTHTRIPYAGRHCFLCRELRRREDNRQNQRLRRALVRDCRRHQAGLCVLETITVGAFTVDRLAVVDLAVVDVPCQRCGIPFRPRRTTARYCSDKCRVAAHRQAAARPSGQA